MWTLSIKKNEIKHLQRDHFVDLCELVDYLTLANIKIVRIDKGTFRNLRNLKRLDVASNSLAYVFKGIFTGLSSLEYLSLQIKFTELTMGHFQI